MFHVEHKLFLVWAASLCLGAAQLVAVAEQSAVQESHVSLPLATSNEESRALIELGMQELLLADDVAAAEYFTKAIAVDDDCSPLAYVGLYLAHGELPNIEMSFEQAEEKLKRMSATPPEAFYLSSLLSLADHNLVAAQEAFAERADNYRADIFSAAWAIQLLHYRDVGYNDDGSVREFQQKSLDRMQALFERRADNPIVCYLRALVEESAPVVSDDALHAAKLAAELLPEHPTVLHLLGHLQYRRGDFLAAAQTFSSARKIASQQNKKLTTLYARLYESVALWNAGKNQEALAIRRELNKIPVENDSKAPEQIFLKWESRTLPLRLLILPEKPADLSDINAAVKTAVPNGTAGKDLYTQSVACIKSAITARLLLQQQKKNDAIMEMRRAENYLKEIEEISPTITKDIPQLITPWMRMHDACIVAVNLARSELYPSTVEVWKTNVSQTSTKPSQLQLPPAVPSRIQPAK